jgi:lipopolysaccharide/colanic/teichoic acid biosynthesis glycosyltransferase
LLGQSENPRETYIHEIMPAKIELNKKYISHPTLSQDIKIMWLTFLKMIH